MKNVSLETVNEIRTWTDGIVQEKGYVEDQDYEDAFELAELISTEHPHPVHDPTVVFHAILCGATEECFCEDAE